jgi:hypothetical protein
MKVVHEGPKHTTVNYIYLYLMKIWKNIYDEIELDMIYIVNSEFLLLYEYFYSIRFSLCNRKALYYILMHSLELKNFETHH